MKAKGSRENSSVAAAAAAAVVVLSCLRPRVAMYSAHHVKTPSPSRSTPTLCRHSSGMSGACVTEYVIVACGMVIEWVTEYMIVACGIPYGHRRCSRR